MNIAVTGYTDSSSCQQLSGGVGFVPELIGDSKDALSIAARSTGGSAGEAM
ncbi:hypothetical protein QM797_19190 [Rhodococcus sp. IEGM 1381]|uniref:hypothetical protein n=1 Tax=Rhodococcus sp. IEGM 1381 TaxID=3047085 RepID=UPI0024B83851|nr:hypothetical protein [Rhodococcus sp. IEGM 1381]MDI9896850.1 hypothetical protein [Rhodococcus sp. IEGM 1381]